MSTLAGQLSFDALLAGADRDNTAREREREYGHLPGDWSEAIPYYRALIDRHHALMVAGAYDEALAVREDAHRLAEKLNNYEAGILADESAPGCALERVTRAGKGKVPLWGQNGSFDIKLGGMRVRITIDGMFGIGACYCRWPGFGAHAVEYDKPFLSETGFRSFLGIHADLPPGQTPETFAAFIVQTYVKRELKGRLVAIKPEYREKPESMR
ncbi:MAG: hypothetical protein GC129_03710 [Proteobacteria bacterium]|nr:hypothetical protein [Pseudomonadota bacterium]